MRTTFKVALVTVALLLGSAGLTAAGDFCLSDGFHNPVVGKAFTLPAKGVCKEFRGFFQNSTVALFGQACGTSDNQEILFRLTVNEMAELGNYNIDLSRATLTGQSLRCFADLGSGGSCDSVRVIQKVSCSPATVPIP